MECFSTEEHSNKPWDDNERWRKWTYATVSDIKHQWLPEAEVGETVDQTDGCIPAQTADQHESCQWPNAAVA